MAYRRSSGKARRYSSFEPAPQTLTFFVPAGLSYIDLSLAASIANRRFYRQGVNWAVEGFTLFATGPGALNVLKIPDTWPAVNAWKKSFALWRKMNDQVLDDEPGIEGRYMDFKVAADADMSSASIQDQGNPTGTILTPASGDAAGILALPGCFTLADFSGGGLTVNSEWAYSTIQVPNDPTAGTTVEKTLHYVGGDTATKVGLINGYEQSRARPSTPDPNVPTADGWMNDLFDVGMQLEELRDDLTADNDEAPYPVGTGGSAYYPGGSHEYPGMSMHSASTVTSTTVGGKTSIRGGNFYCGLIKLLSTVEANSLLQVHLVPGRHRGYLCQPMQEV